MNTYSEIVKLSQVISEINTISEPATIFAARIDGMFSSESAVQITEEEIGNIDDFLKNSGMPPAMEYFLEVSILKEILEGWRYNHQGQNPSLSVAIETIIFYAENDAYPDAFYG
jgi:hypothetical protein